MIHAGIEFHNVEEMIPCEGGLALSRLPESMLQVLRRREKDGVAFHSSGVELRFRVKSGEAKIYLHMLDVTEGLPAQIMYGSFQGGWMSSVKIVGREKSCITVAQTGNLDELTRITRERQLLFDPAMIRILLPYGKCVFDGVEGDVEPPHPGDAPARRCLSYGSSITHGSLSLGSMQTYVARMAKMLCCDSINLGLAGSCHLEPEMAEYIRARKDWDIATVEMGINMLGFEEDAFRTRVREFVSVMAQETRPVFTAGIFLATGGDLKRAARFREILKEETAGKLWHMDGLAILDDPAMISEDMVHPAYEGHEQIAARWGAAIAKELAARE